MELVSGGGLEEWSAVSRGRGVFDPVLDALWLNGALEEQY